MIKRLFFVFLLIAFSNLAQAIEHETALVAKDWQDTSRFFFFSNYADAKDKILLKNVAIYFQSIDDFRAFLSDSEAQNSIVFLRLCIAFDFGPITPEDWLNLAKFAELQRLELFGAYEVYPMRKSGAESFSSVLLHLPKLEKLELDRLQMEEEGVQILMPLVVQLKGLKRFSLNEYKVGDKYIEIIAPHLLEMPQLTHFEMRFMNLKPEGVRRVAEVLSRLPLLEHVGLDLNSSDMSLIAKAIFELKALTYLNLGQDLDRNAIKVLIKILANLINLESLNLQSCHLNDQTAASLIAVLEQLPKLKCINLWRAQMAPNTKERFLSSKKLAPMIVDEIW